MRISADSSLPSQYYNLHQPQQENQSDARKWDRGQRFKQRPVTNKGTLEYGSGGGVILMLNEFVNGESNEAAISAKLVFIEGFGVKWCINNTFKKKNYNPPKNKILHKTGFRPDFSDFFPGF